MEPTFDLATITQSLAPADIRRGILAFEDWLRQFPPGEAPVTHHFAAGIYGREMLIPQGTVLTGKIHRAECLNIVSKGKIRVLTEHGLRTVEAPATFVSPPGVKRVGLALEDTVWTCIHPNPEDETDLGALEARLIAPDFDALQAAQQKMECLGGEA